MTETWHDIAGYDGVYQVSDLGQVRSVAPANSTCTRSRDMTC